MKVFFKRNILSVFFGVVSIAFGFEILFTGKIRRSIVLGDERYILGSVFLIFGFYAIFLVLSQRGKSKR